VRRGLGRRRRHHHWSWRLVAVAVGLLLEVGVGVGDRSLLQRVGAVVVVVGLNNVAVGRVGNARTEGECIA
jgi:hypothetical protein